jgi:hypothetical protein
MEGNPYEVVHLRAHNHTMFDVEGRPLPVGMCFDYINGRVNNACFHLDKLIQHLNTREDVSFVCPDYPRSDNRFLHTVPYYNAGGHCGTSGLEFVWHPEPKLYRRYFKEAGIGEPRACLRRWDVALTFMGADKFRRPEPEETYDDDDGEEDYDY